MITSIPQLPRWALVVLFGLCGCPPASPEPPDPSGSTTDFDPDSTGAPADTSDTGTGTDTTGDPPTFPPDDCGSSVECAVGSCFADYLGDVRGEYTCRPGCVDRMDPDLWCSDDAACCDTDATCSTRGLCL